MFARAHAVDYIIHNLRFRWSHSRKAWSLWDRCAAGRVKSSCSYREKRDVQLPGKTPSVPVHAPARAEVDLSELMYLIGRTRKWYPNR